MRFSFLLLIFASIAGLPQAEAGRPPVPTIRAYRPHEMLVKYKASFAQRGSHRAALSAKGAKILKALNSEGLMRVEVGAGQSVEDAVRAFKGAEGVEFAQPNYTYRKMAVPNDPQYGQQWQLKNSGQTISGGDYGSNPGTAGRDIGLETAWDAITDCSAITVAVIDSGVNYNQEDLSANMWNGGSSYPHHGYDFVDGDNDPMDLDGHGTHVAGIIGARGNNGVGGSGVCWQASIMAVRVLDASGAGSTADIISGINFAVSQGAKVINLSLGQSTYDGALATAINNASSSGVVIVAAAGNDGTNNETASIYPCNFSSTNLICVAALDQQFGLASFSNYGAASVDVGAPGANIYSTVNGSISKQTDASFTGWTDSSGTWGTSVKNYGGTNYTIMANPANYDGTSAKYANSLDARVYKSFNLNGSDSATLEFYGAYATQLNNDYFQVAYRNSAGDPFSSGTLVQSISGSTGIYAELNTYDLSGCLVNPCSIGFRLRTNATTNDFGVALLGFTLNSLTLDTNSYEVMSGTSMAAPVVAGLAAMVRAANPAYTAVDTVAAIRNGGTATASLAGKTSTGKAVSAPGSLQYIATPTGLSASVQ